MPTFLTHTNILAALADELDTEAAQANVRKNIAADRALAAQTDKDRLDAYMASSRELGIQDTYTFVAGRLRSILGAPLTTIVDAGELYDALVVAFSTQGLGDAGEGWTLTPSKAARIATETIDGRNVRGGRRA